MVLRLEQGDESEQHGCKSEKSCEIERGSEASCEVMEKTGCVCVYPSEGTLPEDTLLEETTITSSTKRALSSDWIGRAL